MKQPIKFSGINTAPIVDAIAAEAAARVRAAKRDPRIVYGARCTWWAGIGSAASVTGPGGHAIPCCPHCQSPLFEMNNEDVWFNGVDAYEAKGNPGYRAFVEWLRGRCFPNITAARAVYDARAAR